MPSDREDPGTPKDERQLRRSVLGERPIFVGVAASLIATFIVLWIINPVLKLVRGPLLSGFGYLFQADLDQMYEQAKYGSTNSIVFQIFNIMEAVVISVNVAMVILLICSVTAKGRTERYSSIFTAKLSNIISLATNSKSIKVVLILIISVLVFGAINNMIGMYVSIQAETTFQNRMAAIGPYISPEEEQRFRAEWAWVKSQGGYEKLMSEMDATSAARKQSLPKRLI